MKLKTVELNGATYAEVADGKPLFVADDGKDVPFDVVHTMGTIKRLNGEAQSHRERAEKAEATAKAFEGITDAEAARSALETVKNLSAGDLVKAEKVEEIKREARLASEKQVADAAKASTTRIQELEKAYADLSGQYDNEKVSSAFANSKFIREKVAAPLDMIQATFGGGFKREDGRLVGYDPSGNKIYSRTKPGELADFDEAIEMRIDAYPYKDQILKGSGSSGSGAQPGRHGGGTGGKTMTQAQFDALGPMEQAKTMSGKDRPAIVG